MLTFFTKLREPYLTPKQIFQKGYQCKCILVNLHIHKTAYYDILEHMSCSIIKEDIYDSFIYSHL